MCIPWVDSILSSVLCWSCKKSGNKDNTCFGLAETQLSKYEPNTSLKWEVKTLEIRALFPTVFSREKWYTCLNFMSLSILTFMQFNFINQYWKMSETKVFWICWEGSSSMGRIWPKKLAHSCESWPKAPAVSDACVHVCAFPFNLWIVTYLLSV